MNIEREETRLFSLELFIAKFLRYGVLLAGALMLIGWMMQIDFHRDVFHEFATYRRVSLIDELHAAWARSEWGLLVAYAGLGVLIALPVSRVALTAFVFILERDYTLALCAVLVLSGLALSFALGYVI